MGICSLLSISEASLSSNDIKRCLKDRAKTRDATSKTSVFHSQEYGVTEYTDALLSHLLEIEVFLPLVGTWEPWIQLAAVLTHYGDVQNIWAQRGWQMDFSSEFQGDRTNQ